MIVLPKPDTYYLFKMVYGYDIDFDSLKIQIEKPGRFDYLFKENAIQLVQAGLDGPLLYEKCGKTISGYQIDTFLNGKTRLYGNFKNGKPQDSLVYLYPNGNIKSRSTYKKKNVFIHSFDSLNNLVSIQKNSRKSYFLTNYTWTDYYSKGKIRRIEKRKKHLTFISEYYPNGNYKIKQTRNRRKEFYENGHLWKEYKRRRVNRLLFLFIEKTYDYRILQREYDKQSNLIKKAQYEHWGGSLPNSDFSLENSNWIISLEKYENGKLIYEVHDSKTMTEE